MLIKSNGTTVRYGFVIFTMDRTSELELTVIGRQLYRNSRGLSGTKGCG
jgi:hypothetical protein